MSLDIEARLKAYLASAPQNIHIVQTLEISHPAMSQPYVIWREPSEGAITTEAGVKAVQPVHFEIHLAGQDGSLDEKFEIRIDTVDIDDTFRSELDLIPLATTQRIVCIYREYLSDDLTDMLARAALQAESLAYQVGAATLSAVSPRLNMTRTGEIYTPRDVPMLRAFL